MEEIQVRIVQSRLDAHPDKGYKHLVSFRYNEMVYKGTIWLEPSTVDPHNTGSTVTVLTQWITPLCGVLIHKQ